MTVKEYREKLEQNGNRIMYEFIEPALELWSSNACIGYSIIAAKEAQLEPGQIDRLIHCLESCFDRFSLEEAEARAYKFEHGG